MVEPQFGQSLSDVGLKTRKLVNSAMQRPTGTNEVPRAATMIFRQTKPPFTTAVTGEQQQLPPPCFTPQKRQDRGLTGFTSHGSSVLVDVSSYCILIMPNF